MPKKKIQACAGFEPMNIIELCRTLHQNSVFVAFNRQSVVLLPAIPPSVLHSRRFEFLIIYGHILLIKVYSFTHVYVYMLQLAQKCQINSLTLKLIYDFTSEHHLIGNDKATKLHLHHPDSHKASYSTRKNEISPHNEINTYL